MRRGCRASFGTSPGDQAHEACIHHRHAAEAIWTITIPIQPQVCACCPARLFDRRHWQTPRLSGQRPSATSFAICEREVDIIVMVSAVACTPRRNSSTAAYPYSLHTMRSTWFRHSVLNPSRKPAKQLRRLCISVLPAPGGGDDSLGERSHDSHLPESILAPCITCATNGSPAAAPHAHSCRHLVSCRLGPSISQRVSSGLCQASPQR